MTKDDVLALLQKREGDCLSGEELARSLSLSRTAVWKAIGQLRAEGYPIESAPRRGYRLLPGGDVLTADGVREHLRSCASRSYRASAPPTRCSRPGPSRGRPRAVF